MYKRIMHPTEDGRQSGRNRLGPWDKSTYVVNCVQVKLKHK